MREKPIAAPELSGAAYRLLVSRQTYAENRAEPNIYPLLLEASRLRVEANKVELLERAAKVGPSVSISLGGWSIEVHAHQAYDCQTQAKRPKCHSCADSHRCAGWTRLER